MIGRSKAESAIRGLESAATKVLAALVGPARDPRLPPRVRRTARVAAYDGDEYLFVTKK